MLYRFVLPARLHRQDHDGNHVQWQRTGVLTTASLLSIAVQSRLNHLKEKHYLWSI
jgi:hypothetical protein